MKTKYILHGGSAQHQNDANDKFFKEILEDTPEKVKVLLVHFAGETERDQINWESDSGQFERNKGKHEIEFMVASKKEFYKQISWADVVYLGGGRTPRLLTALKTYKSLGSKFAGKVVTGESAGANVMATYCYSKSGGGVLKGLGLVPVKFMPHYEGENKELLEAIPDKLEIVTLRNYEFKVFYI